MYKTIRHGENSLQYTILPQNDDFRIEGKLSGNGSKGGSALRQAAKRGRKRSFFAYFGLLFVCTVIVGAILVPFLVSTEYLPTPSVWFLRRRIFMDGANYNNTATNESEHRENTSRSDSTIPLDDLPATTTHETRIATKLGSSVTDKTSIVTPTGLGRIYSNLAESFARVSTERAVTTHKWKDDDRLTAATASREVTTEKELVQITTPDSKESTTSSVNRNATSKRPIILPVLAKTNSVVKENGKWVKNRSEPEGWIRSHWPFIDPSTYFQWAGYKSEDSVLLPAILGAALIGMILIITLCLVARNKRTIVATMKKRNRNVVKETGEDNTTLLTNGNASEDE